ncbi:hypothetical protein PoB_007271400 [Plakobranchus ocellatus]|uniref:C2HC/C3H-type domain-containing protein n=1 Tax=Plakobranchus ocellatus TaxID=259542 RepID=A0AAV4DPR8_9GAST|nr:hypothetical protein PoB_007271400 [Plakobranchus ocellatus]
MEPDVHYSDARVPCKTCGRSFAPEVLAKHANICKKNAASSQKRKTFDSSKQRVVECEISMKQIRKTQKSEIKPPKNHWREKHADFINAIRNAKGVQKAIDSGGPLPPPPPPSINPDYIQCPYCSRRFNQQAAERHINFCKEQQSRLPRAKPDAAATAKQNARIGYQAPKLKPKAPAGTGVGGPGAAGQSRVGAPAGRGAATRGGVTPGRGRATAATGKATKHWSFLLLCRYRAGDSRGGGGRGRQQQQQQLRAGSVPRTHSTEQTHHDSYSQRQQHHQQKQYQRHHYQDPHERQEQHPHQQQQSSPDTEGPDDFYNSPQDFYTPYISPRHRGAPTAGASSSQGNVSSRYGDSSSYTNKNNGGYSGRHQQLQQYSSRSNGSNSPYQNVEERSRRADGMPVRARISADTQHHYLSTVDGDDTQEGPGSCSSTPGSSRRGHVQSTPAPFCYECGAKYPVAGAKFCCQCGVKRATCR